MIEKLITELQEKWARAQERLEAARTEVQQYDKAVDALLGITAPRKRSTAGWTPERREKMRRMMQDRAHQQKMQAARWNPNGTSTQGEYPQVS